MGITADEWYAIAENRRSRHTDGLTGNRHWLVYTATSHKKRLSIWRLSIRLNRSKSHNSNRVRIARFHVPGTANRLS